MFTIIGADQKQYGPVSADEVRQWIKDGRADARTLARAEGSDEWKPLSAFAEFMDYTASSGVPPRLPNAAPSAVNFDLLVRRPDFDLAGCFGSSWRLLKENFGLLLTACFITWFLDLIASIIPIADMFMNGVLYGGLYLVYLRRIRGEPASPGQSLAGFGAPFVQLLLAGFLINLLTTLAACALALPGLYLKIAWVFALPLVIDKRLEFWSAMELSRKVATNVWVKLFALTVIVFAPYIVAQGYMYYRVNQITYHQLAPLMSGNIFDNLGKFSQTLKDIRKDKAAQATIENLTLMAQGVLLVNLPFAIGALMYAYEALFGSRSEKAP